MWPDWTDPQFGYLRTNPRASDEEVAEHVDHPVGGVQTVRAFVHNWHRGGNVSGLSELMLAQLDAHRRESTCSVCGDAV